MSAFKTKAFAVYFPSEKCCDAKLHEISVGVRFIDSRKSLVIVTHITDVCPHMISGPHHYFEVSSMFCDYPLEPTGADALFGGADDPFPMEYSEFLALIDEK